MNRRLVETFPNRCRAITRRTGPVKDEAKAEKIDRY